jgi:hypothetical protein
MIITIRESKLALLSESQEEVTYYGFMTALQNFMRGLMKDPSGTEPDRVFTSHGISKQKLLSAIDRFNIMKCKNSLGEKIPDGESRKQAFFNVKYEPVGEDFDGASKRMYKALFPDGRLLEGSIMEAGATACGSVGAVSGPLNSGEGNGFEYDVPAFGVQRRGIYSPRKKKRTKNTSRRKFSGPALKRHNGKGGSISIPKHRV